MFRAHRRSYHLLRASLVTLAFLAVFGCGECEEGRVTKLIELTEIEPGLARQLVSGNDEALRREVERIGFLASALSWSKMKHSFRCESEQSVRADSTILYHPMERLATAVYEVHGDDLVLRRQSTFFAMTPAEICRWFELEDEVTAVLENTELPLGEKSKRIREKQSEFAALGQKGDVARCELIIGDLHAFAGDMDTCIRMYRGAIDEIRSQASYTMYCQALGVLGSHLEERGDVDSMKVCWNEALRTAHRYRLPNQIARITSFYAAYYARNGRLSLAHDLYNEAIRLCREYDCGGYELRYLLASMKHHAKMGAWETVGRLIPRARAVEKTETGDDPVHDILSLRLDQYEALYLMALGRVDTAQAILSTIAPDYEKRLSPTEYALFLLQWARGLVDNGREGEASAVIDDGEARARQARHHRLLAGFALLRAKIDLHLGRVDDAFESLERFDDQLESQGQPLWVERMERNALRAQLFLAAGDTSSALDAIASGFVAAGRIVSEVDPSAHGYVLMSEGASLRSLLHDLVGNDPRLGYALEFYWRDIALQLGRPLPPNNQAPTTPGAQGERLLLELHRRYDRVTRRVRSIGGVHCVFTRHNDGVLRWTATATGIRCEKLELDAGGVNALVTTAWEMMSAEPSDRDTTPGPELTGLLCRLAEVLLPMEVRHPDGREIRNLLVTADGDLARVPFSALDLSCGGTYEPLLQHYDVVYLRRCNENASPPDVTPALVVANPTIASAYGLSSNGTGPLAHAAIEAKTVARMYPGAVVLSGPAATKRDVVAAWEDASLLYFATHVAREPANPYVTLLPLAAVDHVRGPDDAFIDVGDVRAADLSRCELVVLSGCSTGRPFVGRWTSAPTLGDAFLDAGAANVIQTFWDVRDDCAERLMTSFLERWDGKNTSAVRALRGAQRRAMIGPDGVRHPFFWAAYAAKLSRL